MKFYGFYKNVLVPQLNRQSLLGTFLLFVKMLPGGSLEVPLLLHFSWRHWRHAELPAALLHADVALDDKERLLDAHLPPLSLPIPSSPISGSCSTF